MNCKLLLFDLDGTLLRSDKTISEYTLDVLRKCKKKGILIGISTSRSEKNSMEFISELNPDIIISSAGALVKFRGEYIFKAEFTADETKNMIQTARRICGKESEITIDTIDEHYWNYKIEPKKQDSSWGDSIYTDFFEFSLPSLKMCVEIFNPALAEEMKEALCDCDTVRFSDGNWYKFTKKTATKENAIMQISRVCNITMEDIVAFGDDYADIGMLQLCGKGIAMGNAIYEVKAIANQVIGDNDNDGIAHYLTEFFDIKEMDDSMTDFTINEMISMQRKLQEKYKNKWGELSPEVGNNQLLWMIGEIGEVIDIIKKNGGMKASTDIELRKELVEELADVLMYYNDILLCYGISADELKQSYISKFEKNMKRW